MKILLLEDEMMLNESICEYLLGRGHQLVSLTNGDDAYALLQKESFDLLILDINVPGMDGLTLLEGIYKLKIQTPAIYISALVDIEGIARAFDLGCYDYLKKPFHLKELSLRINKVMKTREAPKEHIRLSKGYGFDMANETLSFENVPQILTNKQLQIIRLLAKNRNRIVDFEMFRIYVWDEAFVDNAVIRAEVSRLKKVLKEDFIVNIRAMGYMIETPK